MSGPTPTYRCARCACEYLGDPPPSCGRCTGPLWRLPDRWAGQAIDHAPRHPRLLSAFEIRSQRAARRASGDVLLPIFGKEIPQGWLLVVSGLPSSGKSTFVLRALESGAWETPILVASEEGLSGSGLAERINKLEATKTQFSDAASFPEITALLDEQRPDVLALDSVTTLGLQPEDLLVLRRSYPTTAFVAVVQSVKSGSHAGSQAWLHDADAVVRFEGAGHWSLIKSWISPLKTGCFEEVT